MRKYQWGLALALLLGLAVGVGGSGVGSPTPAQWPMYQSDSVFSGHAWRHSGPDDAMYRISEEIADAWTSPIVVGPNGEIYIAGYAPGVSDNTRRYYIYSLRISEGKEITVSWRRELRVQAEACPAANEFGNVMILDTAGNLYAFDMDGNALWSPRNLMPHPGGSVKGQGAILFNENEPDAAYVLVPNYGHPSVLHKINWLTGGTIWQTEKTPSPINRQEPFLLAYAEEPTLWTFGYAAGERCLVAIDPVTGELLARISEPPFDTPWDEMRAELSTTRGSTVLLLENDGWRVVAVQVLRDGLAHVLWDTQQERVMCNLEKSGVANGTLYIQLAGFQDVASVDLMTGEIGREFAIGAALNRDVSPVVDGENRIYFLADSSSRDRRRLVCYNAWGALRFDITIPGGKYVGWNVASMAMVVPDGFSGGYWNMEGGGLFTSHIVVPLEDGGMAVVFDRTQW